MDLIRNTPLMKAMKKLLNGFFLFTNGQKHYIYIYSFCQSLIVQYQYSMMIFGQRIVPSE